MTTQDPTPGTAPDPAEELATVHRLPVPATTEEGVVDAELMSDEDYQQMTSQRAQALERYQGYRANAVQVVHIVRTVSTHQHTKAAGKAVARHFTYIVAGILSYAQRLWEAKTNSRYERMMRAAETAGNYDALAEWESRAEMARERRHKRRMDWLAAPWALAKTLVAVVATLSGLLLFIGILLGIAQHDIAAVVQPLMAAVKFVSWVVMVITVVWLPFLLSLPFIGTAILWYEGKRRGNIPTWLATSAEQDVDLPIDETTIAAALKALRIPAITDYLKAGMPLQYLTPARRDGRGTHAVVRLPSGVTAERIANRRPEFASGVHRRPTEVWLTMGSEAGILDIWAADKGALAEGAGPYPLLEEGSTDVFKGVPFGKTLRGEPLLCPLRGRNTIVGGMPDQGKSSAARVIMSGAALDPTAELRIWVPDSNFDFAAFERRCSRYVQGPERADIEQICLDMEELVDEIQERGEKLIHYGEPEVTRELASKNVGLHPIVCLLEEAHLAFGDEKFGKRIAAAAESIVRLGRKRLIHLITSTQATTGNSVPQGVTINSVNGIAFAVARWQENDALLGQGAYSAGHRATDLIAGVDKGNAVVKGFTADRSVVAQAYFVSVSREKDQATPIIDRAMALIAKRGGHVPGSDRPARALESTRDLLEDLDEVLGDEILPAGKVPPLLLRLAPRYAPYKGMTSKDLCAQLLNQYEIKIPSTNNKFPVDPVTIRDALAKRATADLDAEN